MIRVVTRIWNDPYDRFTVDDLGAWIGKPVTVGGRRCGLVVDAQVTDGDWVNLTLEVEESEKEWIYGGRLW